MKWIIKFIMKPSKRLKKISKCRLQFLGHEGKIKKEIATSTREEDWEVLPHEYKEGVQEGREKNIQLNSNTKINPQIKSSSQTKIPKVWMQISKMMIVSMSKTRQSTPKEQPPMRASAPIKMPKTKKILVKTKTSTLWVSMPKRTRVSVPFRNKPKTTMEKITNTPKSWISKMLLILKKMKLPIMH